MNAYEIIKKYTMGEQSLTATNAALAEIGAGFHLDINKNLLTEDEIKNSTAGLLDTGTGTFDKVPIVNGELVHAVNEVSADGTVNMPAFVFVGDKAFRVEGKKLIEIKI